MQKVIPAIIPESLEHLQTALKLLMPATDTFQVDIVDGAFVPFTSWPYHEGEHVKDVAPIFSDATIELDLMIERPEETLKEWLNTGATRFVIHVESTEHIQTCVDMVREAGKEVGLSLLNDTDVSVLNSCIKNVDFVQCMGIAEIGRQGNSFDRRVLERVRQLHDAYPGLTISVDGSVNSETIEQLHAAGVSRFVSGSAIYGADDPVAAYHALVAQVTE